MILVQCECGREFEVREGTDVLPMHEAPSGRFCTGSGWMAKVKVSTVDRPRKAVSMTVVQCICGQEFEVLDRDQALPNHVDQSDRHCFGSGSPGARELIVTDRFRAAVESQPQGVGPDAILESLIWEVTDTGDREKLQKLDELLGVIGREIFDQLPQTDDAFRAYHSGKLEGITRMVRAKLCRKISAENPEDDGE